MEIRRVHRSQRRRRKQHVSPALIPILAVFVAVVYVVGISRFGTWLASRVVAPLIMDTVPVQIVPVISETPMPALSAEHDKQRKITLPSLVCYAVQIGVYANRQNAEAQATRLKQLGAAGCILTDGDQFRVLAAGYPSVEDMEGVRAQLAGEGVDSRSYELATDGMRISATGNTEQLDLLEEALSFSASFPDSVYELAVRFDRESLSVISGGMAVSGLKTTCEQHMALVSELSADTTEALEPLIRYFEAAMQRLDALPRDEETGQTAFSSSLKLLYLESVLAYQIMAEDMETS